MHTKSLSDNYNKVLNLLRFHTRKIHFNTKSLSFDETGSTGVISRIYVINLDRQPNRWLQIKKELERLHTKPGHTFLSITRRFSAIDARYLTEDSYQDIILPAYTLGDQLHVEPNQKIPADSPIKKLRIPMSPQEIAVAASHIELWKKIASDSVPYTLILEDDIYFKRNFTNQVDRIWKNVLEEVNSSTDFDLLFLSFEEVGLKIERPLYNIGLVHKPQTGIWQASGYVISKKGALKLINLLPAHGPIDLWMNLKFEQLKVLVPNTPLIEQRVDIPSSNFYSIMPVLSQLGIYNFSKPNIAPQKKLPGPIFAVGEPNSGLTSLAKALSMLGYTCFSDIRELPEEETHNLLKRRRTLFNAYVNVGDINILFIKKMFEIYPNAIFITTSDSWMNLSPSIKFISIPNTHRDKWQILSNLTKCEYPPHRYPDCQDIGQANIVGWKTDTDNCLIYKDLKHDFSPWIISSKTWHGLSLSQVARKELKGDVYEAENIIELKNKNWRLRDDTFPDNLALFLPSNVMLKNDETICLTLDRNISNVRDYGSGAIVSNKSYLYGEFTVRIKPSKVSGLVTGVFLHRNSPHQEIDIEFLGKDTSKILINVFYNPGIEGTKLEHGYRGTPTIINLGFDASESFHDYTISWNISDITWRVDGQVVYRRLLWNPTPIPDLPLEFNINLWHSRSKELAGDLKSDSLPALTEVKWIRIEHNCPDQDLDHFL